MTTSPPLRTPVEALAAKYIPVERRTEFIFDLIPLIVDAIQSGRAAAQGAEGIVICGHCNKVVHECRRTA